MNETVEIRLAHVREAPQIAVMSRDLIEAGLRWSWTPSRVALGIQARDTNVLAACVGRRIVGFAIMRFLQQEAHLYLLGVDTGHQRTGIGRQLIEWLETSALAAGVSIVYLEVRAKNKAALSFYERLGYRRIQRVPGYYQGRETAIRMARDLWCSTPTNATY